MASKRSNTSARTTGRQWRERQEEGVWITLPSGLEARVGGVDPELLLRLGRIPDGLTPLVAAMLDGREDTDEFRPKTQAELLERFEFISAVAISALKEPRVVEDPQTDDEIALEHLELGDRIFLLNTLGAPLRQLERFRDEQARALEAVADEPADAPAAERAHADPAVGAAADGA